MKLNVADLEATSLSEAFGLPTEHVTILAKCAMYRISESSKENGIKKARIFEIIAEECNTLEEFAIVLDFVLNQLI